METPAPDDLIGRTIAGRFKIERHLRRGGMGAVYVANDATTGKLVAIKVIRQALLDDAGALVRFKREMRLVTELVHDNIVRAHDSGEDAGLLYIAMELLEGESLRDRLDARGRMPWQETLPLVEQIVRALEVAHNRVVIHRDLKPENVMLVGAVDGSVRAKLLDFGVAKQAQVEGQSGTSNMTGTGLIVGTPGYVAPEVVLDGRTDDPRSDFYALGVTWFEMLTGQKPFTAKTAFALAMRHAHEPAPTPTSFVPYSPVPAPIERLVLRLLAKSPAERPTSAAELLRILASLADESQRSLAGTPVPGTFEPTVTDVTNGNRTGVVPFVGTPKPGGLGTPGAGAGVGVGVVNVVSAAGVASSTPATALVAQQSGTPGSMGMPAMTPGSSSSMTPPPAELLKAIPKKWFAVAALAILCIGGTGAVLGVIALNEAKRSGIVDDDRALAGGGGERAARDGNGSTSGVDDVPPLKPLPTFNASQLGVGDVKVSSPSTASDAGVVVGALPVQVATQTGTDVEPEPISKGVREKIREKREERREKLEERREKAEEKREAREPGVIHARPRPRSAGWKVSLDGGFASETPKTFSSVTPGTHTLRFKSDKLDIDVTKTVVVKAGEELAFTEELAPAANNKN